MTYNDLWNWLEHLQKTDDKLLSHDVTIYDNATDCYIKPEHGAILDNGTVINFPVLIVNGDEAFRVS